MNKTVLVQYIFSLNDAEIKNFRHWLASPFFNNRQELILLYNWIVDCGKNNIEITKSAAFDHVFPTKKYNDQQLRLIMSYLLKQLKQFLIWQKLQENEIDQQVYLLDNLRKRGLEKAFKKQWKKTAQIIEKNPNKNQRYYFNHYQIQLENYAFLKRYVRERKMPLQEIDKTFTIFSISTILKWHCNILTHKSVTQEEYDTRFLDQVLAYLKDGYHENIPAIQVYYQAYQALITRNEAHYQKLKTAILTYFYQFSTEEIRDIILLAINFCIKKLNSGESDFLKEVFAWYKKGLNTNIFIINGELSRFTYNNMVLAGLKLTDFEWTGKFIQQYKTYINKDYQHDTYYYNLALWHQFQHQYEEVQLLLRKVTFKDVLHALHAKRILLKIYYETDEIKALDSLLDSIKIYLYRHKNLGYHKNNYLKLVRYTQKLIRLNPHDMAMKLKLKKEIEEEKSLLEKAWFLQQLN